MKVFRGLIHFTLPEDFDFENSDLADVYQEIADYIRNEAKERTVTKVDSDVEVLTPAFELLYKRWLDVHARGKKLCGFQEVLEYKDGEWSFKDVVLLTKKTEV